jgi:FMNH2-dependent dimethyl sulfone monooxygenase
MRLGIWAPLPHTIRPEPDVERALDELGRPGVGEAQDRSFRFVADIVCRAEELGFDITLVAERLVARDLEAWVVSSALAVLTDRIQIMTAAHPGIVLPQMAAKMGASIDRLSGGRFAINVVPGRRSHEFDLFGNGSWLAEAGPRYKRMEEFIDVLSGLWTQERYSIDGDFFQIADGALATRPMSLPRPPIFAASGSERGMEIVARTCDTWFVSHEPGLAAYEANVLRIAADIASMRDRARRYGRTLGFGLSTYVICADTMEQALREATDIASAPDANVTAKALGAGLVGTPDVIVERIQRYEDSGIDCLMLQFHPMRDGLERFGRDILPRIRSGARASGASISRP